MAEDPWQLVSELRTRNTDLEAENAKQAKRIDQLMVQVAELKARVGMNPRNSSEPPSSEGYSKPSPKSRRVRSGRKPGKQPGDPGKHLPRRDIPDEMVTHEPEVCSGCGDSLDPDAPLVGESSRQVFDIPPVVLSCVEHVARRRRCSCGAETSAGFPPWVTAPTCYGPGMRARACYLVAHQHIPFARVAEMLSETYGATISPGTIVAMVNQGSDMLAEFQLAFVASRAAQARSRPTALRCGAPFTGAPVRRPSRSPHRGRRTRPRRCPGSDTAAAGC